MPTKPDIIRAGVLGWPVSHSQSPRLHQYWLRQYGIGGSYEPIAVELKDLGHTLKRLAESGYAGVNLTLPHKEAVLRYIDETDAMVERIGAVNTIVMKDGKLIGSNTDAYGFVQNLKSHGLTVSGNKAMVLGAGGAARAVCAGLLDEGADIIIANRTFEKAQLLAQLQGGRIMAIKWQDSEAAMDEVALLINTTSLGMKGQAPLDISLERLPEGAAVTDVVYNPLITPLLAKARERGHRIIDGLGMLLWQAQPGFEAWFGVLPEVTEELREHVLAGMK